MNMKTISISLFIASSVFAQSQQQVSYATVAHLVQKGAFITVVNTVSEATGSDRSMGVAIQTSDDKNLFISQGSALKVVAQLCQENTVTMAKTALAGITFACFTR